MPKQENALPWVIPEYCEGCGSCVNACRHELLFMIENEQEGVLVPWMEDFDRCTGCGMCEAACPVSAICLTSYPDKARERFLRNRPSAVAPALKLNLEKLESNLPA